MNRFNKRFDWIVSRGSTSAAVILVAVLVAVLAWPSAGWSKTTGRACNVHAVVMAQLKDWAATLQRSWQQKNPDLIVNKYGDDAILLPTCGKEPAIGRSDIMKYFKEKFLPFKPTVEKIGNATTGGDCNVPFGSGLYTFKLITPKGEVVLPARYTYIFRRTVTGYLITQHHSSVVPGEECPQH